MLTMNCIIEKKIPLNEPLSNEILRELIEENRDKNYSYIALLREYINGSEIMTVRSLLKGYSGIKLFKI